MPPGAGIASEQGGPIAHQRQIVRTCHSSRTGADYCDARRVFAAATALENLVSMKRGDAATAHRAREDLLQRCRRERLGTELIGEKSFERADGDWRVNFAPSAGIFAGSPAAATANRGDRIGVARDTISLGEASFGDELHVPARVGLDRTRIEARDVLAKPPEVTRLRINHGRHEKSPSRSGYFLQKVRI